MPPPAGSSARSGAAPACPSCGAANDPSNNFCVQCGAELAGEPRAGQGSAAVAGPMTGPAAVVHLLASGEERGKRVGESLIIGRSFGDIQVPGDTFLSGRHAAVQETAEGYVLRDLGSTNGTFVRVRKPIDLRTGDQFMVGQQVFRFTAKLGSGGRGGASGAGGTRLLGSAGTSSAGLVRIDAGGAEAERYALRAGRVTIGRDEGDIVFPGDELLSARHASVALESGGARAVLRDEGSRNGVYIRISEEWTLRPGDLFVVGRQVFRFDATSLRGSAGGGGEDVHG